jgi:hypothetical protein
MREALVTTDKFGEASDVDTERGARKALATTTSTFLTEPEPENWFMKGLRATTASERVAAVVAFGAVCSASVAISIDQSVVVIVAGTLSVILSMCAYWQQTRVSDINALHETYRSIQAEIEVLHAENGILAENVAEVRTSVQHLEDVQQVLAAVTSTQDYSIDTLRQQVEGSKKALKQMQSNVKATVLQHLLCVIFRGDSDGNFVIDDDEASNLIRRIQSVPGLYLNEVELQAVISGRSFDSVLVIIEGLLSPSTDVPVDKKILGLSQR